MAPAPAPADMPSESHQVVSNGDVERDGAPSPDLSKINKPNSSSSPPAPVAHSTPHHKDINDQVTMETTDHYMNEEKDDESLREIPVNSVKTARSETIETKRRPSDLGLDGLAGSAKIKSPHHSRQRKSSSTSLDGQLTDNVASISKSLKKKRSRIMSVSSTESDVGGENKSERTARKVKKKTISPLSGPSREKLTEQMDILPPLQSNRKRGKVSLPPLPAIGEGRDTRKQEEETNC